MKEWIFDIVWIKNEFIGNYKKVREFYLFYVEVCRFLCLLEDLLLEKMYEMKWKKFLEFLGLKMEVFFFFFLEFGKEIVSYFIVLKLDVIIKYKLEVLVVYIL